MRAALASLLLLAACSPPPQPATPPPLPQSPRLTTLMPTSRPAAPIPTTQPAPPSSTWRPIQVDHPLAIDNYIADPCASLTADQGARFSATDAGRPRLTVGLPSCDWSFGASGRISVNVAYDPYDWGLGGIEALHREGLLVGYYIPTSVEGYPAAYNAVGDGRPFGSCDLTVGTAPMVDVTVSFNSERGDDGCTAAKNLATAVIQTIRTGG
ncbi:MAG TPA: DUF3558 domain-containing protein [Pseudonocardiaceae bacterium]